MLIRHIKGRDIKNFQIKTEKCSVNQNEAKKLEI